MVSDKIFHDAKKLGEMFAGIVESAQAWKDITSLKEATASAHDTIHKLQSEIEELTNKRDQLKAQLRAEVSREMATETELHANATKALLERLDSVKKFGLEN
jgi:FtsZ-binding cell division protein ZapB